MNGPYNGQTDLRLDMSSIRGGMSLSLLLLSTNVSRLAIRLMLSGSFSRSFLCNHNVCKFSILRTTMSHCSLADLQRGGAQFVLHTTTSYYLCMSSGKCCRQLPPISSHSSAGSATMQSGMKLKQFMDRSRCCNRVRFLNWGQRSHQDSDSGLVPSLFATLCSCQEKTSGFV